MIMDILTWINFILIVGYIFYRENRIYLTFSRTFWYKKITTINVMWCNKPVFHRKGCWVSHGIFHIPIRNAKKMHRWDSEKRESEYK